MITVFLFWQSTIYSATDFTDVPLNIPSLIDGASFPTSSCTKWCPPCQQSKCSLASPKFEFQGNYLYIPGDILITGMLPLSQKWDKMSTGSVCSGLRLQSNFDIMSEAFLYAVLSVHDRYPDLQNISIGALLLDTCSDSNRASQILLNFESCMYDFDTDSNNWEPSPALVPAYIVIGNDGEFVGESTTEIGKLTIGIHHQGDLYRNERKVFDSSSFNFEILANFLHTMNLSYVGLITSFAADNADIINLFETTRSKNICVAYNEVISTKNAGLYKTVRKSTADVVIVYATSEDFATFFRKLTTEGVIKTWILIETRENWLDTAAFPIPLGSVIFSPYGKQNSNFNVHMTNVLDKKQTNVSTNNPWIDKYKEARINSNIQTQPFSSDLTTHMQASDVIRSVDVSLEAISHALKSVCGNENNELCPEFASSGGKEVLQAFDQLWSTNKSDEPVYPANIKYQHYVIRNLQQQGSVEVRQCILS